MRIGKLLEEKFLLPHALSPASLAKALHIDPTKIEEVLSGEKEITPEMDLRLCTFFDLEEGFFLALQQEEILKTTREKLQEDLKKILPRSRTSSPKKIQVGLLCGGPSPERGISLNSARSILDHLSSPSIEIHPIYVDVFKNFYSISPSQLYSNTPSDFDFKLTTAATKLSQEELLQKLKTVDIVFPAIHGAFGEDGELQAFLEQHKIPFIGSTSQTCKTMFDKHNAASLLKRHGFPILPTEVLRNDSASLENTISLFFKKHHLNRVVVKPIAGGSSIGVSCAFTPEEALEKTRKLFESGLGTEALLEPFCVGREFTIIILQNDEGAPVALIPTEIEVNYEGGGIFDYRRKYLPTTNTHWYCPPRFDDKIVQQIRTQAEELFSLFHMRDFARLDGWLLQDGTILFSDFNPISGLEQNSFIFQQASRIGLTHSELLRNILKHACTRENICFEEAPPTVSVQKEPVHILFGGKTAERQVSLMSGTNVWLKLRTSEKYAPEPFLLDQDNSVWHLPYAYSLNHTVEEIHENCLTAETAAPRMELFLEDIKKRLHYAPKDHSALKNIPKKLSMDEFFSLSQQKNAFVFLGLHGGEGENGVIQEKLEKYQILYNGSGPKTSEVCMDKYLTGQAIANMNDPHIQTVPKKQIKLSSLSFSTKEDFATFWNSLSRELASDTFIIKPQRDGCSAGIVRLFSSHDLETYRDIFQQKLTHIPPNTFTNQPLPIEMPLSSEDDFLIESFIETDYIRISKNSLQYMPKKGWIELTVGVLENHGVYQALNPSITIAEGEVLSVEEKFQGGTGVNITPPLEEIIPTQGRQLIKTYIEKAAKALNIHNYARIDVFFNIHTSLLYIIEANTLPGLTPSTVLYHQALAETPPLYPKRFLETLIERKKR